MTLRTFFSFISHHHSSLSTAALVVGFVIDVITFRTLNLELAQLILAAHLVIVACAIMLDASGAMRGLLGRLRALALIAHQYSTGALLSAFLVLYSASASLAASWPFLILVLCAAVVNETVKLERYRLPFQTTLFFLNLILFAALAVPIAVSEISLASFVMSLGVAAIAFTLFVWLGRVFVRRAFSESLFLIRSGWVLTLVLIVFFYFTNLIPPIPLTVKAVGFYHSVSHVGSSYYATDEFRPWFERFVDTGGVTLHLSPGEPAYLYSAVFAPARVDTDIVHRWERFDPATDSWQEGHLVRFSITGGRRGGFREYSLTESPTPGRYRVSIETTRGQVIGRAYLTVVHVRAPVATREVVLE